MRNVRLLQISTETPFKEEESFNSLIEKRSYLNIKEGRSTEKDEEDIK